MAKTETAVAERKAKTETKPSVHAAVIAMRDEISKAVYEMDEVVNLSMLAILSRGHLCLVGRPGAAKSKVTLELTKRITSSKLFLLLLMKTTAPEEVFGPITFSGMRQDRYVRNTTNRLPDADLAFFDEIFKANSAILNSLLTAMNERQFDNDGQRMQIPLVSLFGASNELPQEEGLNAMWDRFILRTVVDYMAEEDSFRKLFRARAERKHTIPVTATLSLEQLAEAQAEVAKVALPDSVMDRILLLRRELMKQKIEVSPRRWSDSIPVLQAQAFLAGRTQVTEDDLLVYEHILWQTAEQRTAVRRIVNQTVNPEREQGLAAYDSAAQAWREFEALDADQKQAQSSTFGPKLRTAGEKLKAIVAKLEADKRDLGDLKTKLETLRKWHREMADLIVGKNI